ncbi:hypothetical protein AAFM81_004179 [Vibrio fluvialis]
MSQFSNFAAFTSSQYVTVNYSFEPISEFIELLNKLYQTYQGDLQKEICRSFKDVLNIYLGGREPDDDNLHNIFNMCRSSGYHNVVFMDTAKRLYELVKNHIDFPNVLKRIFEKLQGELDGNIAILCRDSSDWKTFELIADASLLNRMISVSPKQLRLGYIDCPLVIIAPSYWFKELLPFPSSAITYIIQPQGFASPYFKNDIFDGVEASSLWTSRKYFPSTDKMEIYIESPVGYKKETTQTENLSGLLTELSHQKPPIFTREIKSISGQIEHIEINRRYLTVNKDGGLIVQSFDEDDELGECSYIVSNIDYSDLSDDDVNRHLREHMESWKAPLRSYHQPYNLPRVLESFGAKHAKSYNIKNWMRKDTIRPSNDDDFIALLKFAQIPEEEFPTYFSLAKNIISNCISIGHRKSEISRELVANELRKRLNENQVLPPILNVGVIKVSILALG